MITIALAEDHPKMRGLISSMIKKLGGYHLSMEAENGYQLIKQLHASKKIPDIAIIDVQMPVMDGLALTHFITCHYPDIKVLAVSTHTHPTVVQDIMAAGAKGYLVKENLTTLLSNALKAICVGNPFIDDTIENKPGLLSATINRKEETNTAYVEITEKEMVFLQLSATAISYDQIAHLMNVAKESVYNYQKSLKEKLGVSDRQAFTLYAIQHGIAKVARWNDYPPRINKQPD